MHQHGRQHRGSISLNHARCTKSAEGQKRCVGIEKVDHVGELCAIRCIRGHRCIESRVDVNANVIYSPVTNVSRDSATLISDLRLRRYRSMRLIWQ